MKFTPIVMAMLICLVARGQDRPKFQTGVGIGYANAGGRNGGIIFLEPAYRINDKFAIGILLEYAMLGSSQASDPTSGIISLSLNGRYYFNQNKLRPFVGGGLGVYFLSNDILAPGFQSVNSFGFYPRVGFDYGHFNLTLDYSFISRQMPSTVTAFGVPVGSTPPKDANYLGLKLGYAF